MNPGVSVPHTQDCPFHAKHILRSAGRGPATGPIHHSASSRPLQRRGRLNFTPLGTVPVYCPRLLFPFIRPHLFHAALPAVLRHRSFFHSSIIASVLSHGMILWAETHGERIRPVLPRTEKALRTASQSGGPVCSQGNPANHVHGASLPSLTTPSSRRSPVHAQVTASHSSCSRTTPGQGWQPEIDPASPASSILACFGFLLSLPRRWVCFRPCSLRSHRHPYPGAEQPHPCGHT